MAGTTRTVVQTSRRCDHLYDPTYTVSGAREFYRQTQAAQAAGIERVPDDRNLFSEVPSLYPSASYRLSLRQDIPNHVARQQFVPPSRPGEGTSNKENLQRSVEGGNRAKFFRKPAASASSDIHATVVLDRGTFESAAETFSGSAKRAGASSPMRYQQTGSPSNKEEEISGEEDEYGIQYDPIRGQRTIAIQTVFRDQEAQTDPYTPDFTLPQGEEPDILHLAEMKYDGEPGSQLPPGEQEMEAIDRLRRRREIERSLPPMTDEASFEIRKKLMQKLELENWKVRERKEDEQNERRVESVMDVVHDVVKQREYISEQRLEDMRRRLESEKDQQIANVEKKRIKYMRKLNKSRQKTEATVDALTGTGESNIAGTGKRGTRDIVGEYADYGSQVYAPLLRAGRQRDVPGEAERYRSEYYAPELKDSGDVDSFAQTIPRSVTRAKTEKPKSRKALSGKARKDRAIATDLERVRTMLKSASISTKEAETKTEPKQRSKQPRTAATTGDLSRQIPLPSSSLEQMPVPQWRKPQKKVERPPTPTFDTEDEKEKDDLDNAALLLQKLLRGRTTQNMMFEGKERRLELIKEMRLDLLTPEERAEIDNEEASRRHEAAVKQAARSTLDVAVGEVLSGTLDYLGRELVRQQEMERINSQVHEAEETRRRREAEEGGTRQAEVRIRTREDYVYRQLFSVHQDSARDYVSTLLRDVVEEEATREASEYLSLPAEQEADADGASIRNLVGSFLLPEVERRHVERAVELEEKKYVEAARQALEHT
eukprot:gb/GECG01016253.1/.p1 GENE.gb/GECG01016253.1/~~gb/GECG01016253.1/.p1  ORF type:complete len:771 (+),score=132.89 gb/GECG01016253.1/:1-2313(+)